MDTVFHLAFLEAYKQNQSTAANRRDLVSDHQKQKVTAKELQRLEKQKKLAQTLRLKSEAEASGEDMERRKAWEWSIEQNERWEAKQEESKIKSDTHFHSASEPYTAVRFHTLADT